jgi:hypothetical protein
MMGCASAASSTFRVLAKRIQGPESSRRHRADNSAPKADDPFRVSPVSDIADRTSPAADSESTYAAELAWLRAARPECAGEESQDSGAEQDGEPRAKLNLFARDRFFALEHELIWT